MSEEPPRDGLHQLLVVRSVFLKGLALIYALAFGSLAEQIVGLVGRRGIVPVAPLLAQLQRSGAHWWQYPTLAWFSSGDGFLCALCLGGVALALFVFTGFVPKATFFLLWVAYLSLVTVGGDFLGFQWDNLLLEAGLIAVLWAPFNNSPKSKVQRPKSTIADAAGVQRTLDGGPWTLDCLRILDGRFLICWLLFRLMSQSGLVKWLSHDPTWAHFTALRVYYETMPIPNPLSWVMHQLPAAVQTISAAGVFFIEVILPWFIWVRPLRRIVFWLFVGFQALIFLTGNYGFFNLLTMLLCVPLLDDSDLRAFGTRFTSLLTSTSQASGEETASVLGRWAWGTYANRAACLAVFWFGLVKFALMFGLPLPGTSALSLLEPFRSINTYGLFAVMTTTRPEIIVEGSNDGKTWLPYEFKYKPGPLDRRPPVVAPYQPRLDWQMWFAALGSYQDNVWFVRFCERLLQGSPPVLALLQTNPFPGHPPRFIRASLYQYHFTTFKDRRATGRWWRRDFLRAYCPVLSLKN